MSIICIDPGITNIGLVAATVTERFTIASVDKVFIIDLKRYGTGHMHDCACKFFEDFRHDFESAKRVVLEKQPFMSAGYPLELLFRERYGSKCVFICPQTLHKKFDLATYEYDARKQRSVAIVETQLQAMRATETLEYIHSLERKHDVTDAFLLLFMYCMQRQKTAKSPTVQRMHDFAFTPKDPLFLQKMRERFRK